MSKKITDSDFVSQMSDSNSLIGNFGGTLGQIRIDDFRKHLNDNDEEVLNTLAFYIDVNKASSLGSTRVDVGGNMGMRQLWEDAATPVLMDAAGNYCKLNRKDCRYTETGESILDSSGSLLSKWSDCDVMIIIPQYYGRVQTVTVGSTTIERLWLSLVPLPGGYTIPQQVVGKFKCYSSSGLRSLPNIVPTGSYTINGFWDIAQSRSKNHGLANLDFRDHLLFHMMAKYGYRDSQGCKGSDGTSIWGVGLDGTESGEGYDGERNIKTGATLRLGMVDGKYGVTASGGHTCHSVNVLGFENPWGQVWEMTQGLCSVGTDTYCWRHNWLPTGTPTAATFDNIDHVVLQRQASSGSVTQVNMIASKQGQGVYMIPKASVSGISYGDYYWYGSQLWLWGGDSNAGSNCGLADSASDDGWSYAASSVSARLAYYGAVREVSPTRLAELA